MRSKSFTLTYQLSVCKLHDRRASSVECSAQVSSSNIRAPPPPLLCVMPPTVQIFDALWHCLCPRFQTKTLAIAHTARPIVRKSLSRRDPAASRAIHQSSKKCYRTPSARNIEPIEVQANNWRHHLTERKDDDVSGNGVRKAPPLAEVYGELRWAANKGEFIKVQELVRTLVIERRERPNVRLYAGLILANICPEYGSLGRVERLLQEMVEEGIQPDSSVCHAVLKV